MPQKKYKDVLKTLLDIHTIDPAAQQLLTPPRIGWFTRLCGMLRSKWNPATPLRTAATAMTVGDTTLTKTPDNKESRAAQQLKRAFEELNNAVEVFGETETFRNQASLYVARGCVAERYACQRLWDAATRLTKTEHQSRKVIERRRFLFWWRKRRQSRPSLGQQWYSDAVTALQCAYIDYETALKRISEPPVVLWNAPDRTEKVAEYQDTMQRRTWITKRMDSCIRLLRDHPCAGAKVLAWCQQQRSDDPYTQLAYAKQLLQQPPPSPPTEMQQRLHKAEHLRNKREIERAQHAIDDHRLTEQLRREGEAATALRHAEEAASKTDDGNGDIQTLIEEIRNARERSDNRLFALQQLIAMRRLLATTDQIIREAEHKTAKRWFRRKRHLWALVKELIGPELPKIAEVLQSAEAAWDREQAVQKVSPDDNGLLKDIGDATLQLMEPLRRCYKPTDVLPQKQFSTLEKAAKRIEKEYLAKK